MTLTYNVKKKKIQFETGTLKKSILFKKKIVQHKLILRK